MRTTTAELVFANDLEPHEINERVLLIREVLDGNRFILGTLKRDAFEMKINEVDYLVIDVKQDMDGKASVVLQHKFDIEDYPDITTINVRPVFMRDVDTGKLRGVSHVFAVSAGLIETETCF